MQPNLSEYSNDAIALWSFQEARALRIHSAFVLDILCGFSRDICRIVTEYAFYDPRFFSSLIGTNPLSATISEPDGSIWELSGIPNCWIRMSFSILKRSNNRRVGFRDLYTLIGAENKKFSLALMNEMTNAFGLVDMRRIIENHIIRDLVHALAKNFMNGHPN